MRVLSVCASDRAGGAAIGAYRLHQALRRAGADSQMLVWRKVTADASVHRIAERLHGAGRLRRRLAAARHGRRLGANPRASDSAWWSLNQFDYPIADAINAFEADIVQLHWVGDNVAPIAQLARVQAPLVWTLRDMWAFTGGCHYAGACVRYRGGCGDCPQLIARGRGDLSAQVHRDKRRAWESREMTLVCISHWLADCARESALFQGRRIEVIGNAIDAAVFKPLDKAAARGAFNLPADKKLILFGAVGGTSDRRKGFAYLERALSGLAGREDCALVVFGGEGAARLELGLPTVNVGRLGDEVSLSLLYSACDVYVLPTLQEALGNTLIEALACGTPCVVFGGSGAVDVARHGRDGYVARREDSADLLAGIERTLARTWSRDRLHRELIARYGEGHVAAQYLDLYRSLPGASA